MPPGDNDSLAIRRDVWTRYYLRRVDDPVLPIGEHAGTALVVD
jgi:hypothetical protein